MPAALGIFLAVLSTLVLPLPEELALLGAGWFAHEGAISLVAAWLVSWSAVIAGDTASYFIGRGFLPALLRTRPGKRLVKPDTRAWAEELVKEHGFRAILLGRFLVGLRGPVYLAIGASKYPALRFSAINAAVGLVEVALLVGLGYVFGASARLAHEVKWGEIAIAVLMAAILLVPLFFRRRLMRRRKQA